MNSLREIGAAVSRALSGEPVKTADLGALAGVGFCVLAISTVFNGFGLIHFEWWGYVPFHLGPGSIWAKIFDSRSLDQGVYAGRELSYLIDHLDMLAVARSVEWGWPLFISITHVVVSVIMGVWLAWFAARDLRLGSLIGLLLALLFWTTPFIYVHFLMRTAKGLTALGMVILAIEIHRACLMPKAAGKNAPLGRRPAVVIALAAGVMSFSDRQGFYFLLCALAFMALEWVLSRARVARDIFLLLVVVLACELVYFSWLAPALTRIFWGYEVDFSFNELPLAALLAQKAYFAREAWELLLQNIGFTLGRMPAWAVLPTVLAVWGAALARDLRSRAWRAHVPVAGLIAAMLAGLWMMYVLMILRHPRVLWADTRTVYYWIPTGALVILGLTAGVGDWVGRHPGRKIALAAVLLVLLAGNIAALPGHYRVFASGHLQDSIRQSVEMRYALTHRGDPGYLLPDEIERIGAFRALYALAPEHAYPKVPWEQYGYGEFYRRTRSSGAATVRFVEEFGGNADPRFLSTTGRFFNLGGGRSFIGTTEPSAEMRMNIPANRVRGEFILQRVEADTRQPLTANFTIHAQPQAHAEPRFERWHGQVELPAGSREASVNYEIDGSGLPALFTVDLPSGSAGRVIAGWRNPYITDVGRDSPGPVWLNRSNAPAVVLDETALAKLLPDPWRPVQAMMRHGRVAAGGIELSPGGEIWIKARGIVLKFTGTATALAAADRKRLTRTRGFWYKAGRLQTYVPPMPENPADGAQSFQAWCAEPGGWLVISTDPNTDLAPVLVRVNEVREDR